MTDVNLRFYEELNDFLPIEKRKISFTYTISPNTGIKNVIESLGVPHTEIDLILVNGNSVDFGYKMKDGDNISVYPVFESFDISEINHLHPKPLRQIRFILDVHLGKLARYLRLLGFDVAYDNHFSDQTIISRGVSEKRIILTRDIGILKNKIVTHGYWLRNTQPEKQVEEILHRFDLHKSCHPFTRCMECNGMLQKIEKGDIAESLPPLTRHYYENFMQCTQCKKIYWEGTHYKKLNDFVKKFCK